MTAPKRHRPESAWIQRFWAGVDKTDECWLWTRARSDTGYGSFRINNRTYNVHKLSYELLNGPVPSGLVLDHLCRVRHCVRPDHLEAVTTRTNLARGESPSMVSHLTNICLRGHSNNFRWNNAARTKRTCRACDNIRRSTRSAA